jgi:hypothetical protein
MEGRGGRGKSWIEIEKRRRPTSKLFEIKRKEIKEDMTSPLLLLYVPFNKACNSKRVF